MPNIRTLSLLTLCITHLTWASLLHAENAVSPPPQNTQTTATPLSVEDDESNTNLQKELTPPTTNSNVSINSYVRKNDRAKITEYSSHGRVFQIKVQPAGGLPAYYLEDSDGDGNFNKRLPGGNKRINPPMWIIQKF